jgi:hypothetical protein
MCALTGLILPVSASIIGISLFIYILSISVWSFFFFTFFTVITLKFISADSLAFPTVLRVVDFLTNY